MSEVWFSEISVCILSAGAFHVAFVSSVLVKFAVAILRVYDFRDGEFEIINNLIGMAQSV
jgi:hypothetical protein